VLLVPTRNPGSQWAEFLQALDSQTIRPQRVIVLDSESTDGSAQATQTRGHTVHTVQRRQFNHGGTRQTGLDQYAQNACFAIFLTQDAILANPEALAQLLAAFDDPQVAAAYGRQLPHANAIPIAAHARLFNYPPMGHTITAQDKAHKGIKTCFLSNSFAAYRLSALRQAGGFAPDLILGEDMHLAARLLLAGHAIRYQASAQVYHSHNYSLQEEMARYFDTGVFHAQQSWLMNTFGGAGNEGLKFMTSEIRHLGQHAPLQLPQALLRSLLKAAGFKLGRSSAHFPVALNKRLSMHKGYWA
jgi:rhamnosyltransferase